MATTVPTASLEPYLRARAVNSEQIPAQDSRARWDRQRSNATVGNTKNDDFIDFLNNLLRVVLTPVTLPLRWITNLATSPLTISVVLKLILLGLLTLASAFFSILAVGAWWYSWGTGGPIELEGWLYYGSKNVRTPHVLVPLAMEQFQEDLRYDVQVELELVRPIRGGEEMGNFMLSLQLRSARDSEITVVGASQPSLPPPPLPSTLLSLPSLPLHLLPPCLLPWPFRPLCPSRLLGYGGSRASRSKIRERRAKGRLASPASGKDVVLMTKELMEGIVVKPGRSIPDAVIGSAFVSIGREDSFSDNTDRQPREVRTTGWVVIRFIPRPSGIRWLLSAHPLPPLLLLPPLSLTLTLSSSLFAFLIITYIARPKNQDKSKARIDSGREGPMTEEALLEEKRKRTFEDKDREERREAERRRREWEEVESSALGGSLRKIPQERKRESTLLGGSETTAPTVRSLAAPAESEDGTDDTVTETTESVSGAADESRGSDSD